MQKLWWKTVGKGNYHLVLMHGWGMNAGIWHSIQKKLALRFTLHLVDLPGFGRSQEYGVLSLHEMAKCLLEHAPKKAIWLGWSFGGLVASQVALSDPKRVHALVTVASSPCFIGKRRIWPGIKPEILTNFQKQLRNDFQRTIERFLMLQTIGGGTARKDVHILKKIMLSLPMPRREVLNSGLEILKTTDFRKNLSLLQLPHLRIYGYLDALVPRKIAPLLDTLWPHSQSLVLTKAAHIPFISHPCEFCSALIALTQHLE